MAADFSTELMKVRREWNGLLGVLRGNNCQPRILCPEKYPSTMKGKYNLFQAKNNRGLIDNKHILKELQRAFFRES